jgi:hypothetical protein
VAILKRLGLTEHVSGNLEEAGDEEEKNLKDRDE